MIEQEIYKESIFINSYLGDSDIIQKHINHILEFDKGTQISNKGGYHSGNISFGFYDLINFATSSLSSIGENVSLSNFWININKGEDENISHIHAMDTWSAVYYHKVCCEKCTINFHHLVPTIVPNVFSHIPKEKTMVFFKSDKPHSVSPCNQANHERISIAFNFLKIKEKK